MDRREFLAATAVAATSPLPKLDTLGQSATRQYIELRRYHLLPGTKQRAFSVFVGDVAIPAMNRAGVERVGALALEQVVSTDGDWPRNFSLDPTGSWLLVANQRSDSIVVFRRDQKSGRLTPTRQRLALPKPVCLRFRANTIFS